MIGSTSTLVITVLAVAGATACAHGGRVTFQSTDATFQPRSRTSPPDVYRHREEIPHVALRSVGLIEVSGSNASARAAAKGQELGCWALIEHALFDGEDHPTTGETRRSGERAPSALLGHGTTHSVAPVRVPVTLVFNCVVLATNRSGAAMIL